MFLRELISVLFLIGWNLVVSSKPNIVFILTDDQDVLLDGLGPLIKTKQLIADEGATFVNAFATTPLCCPSRSSILTGLYLHSHGTLNNSLEGDCSSRNWQNRHEPNTFGPLLRRAGYRTFYAGKYLNKYGHKAAGGVKHVPEGWDWWIGLVGNSAYYNYTLSVNGTEVNKADRESDYLTDVLRDYSLRFIDQVETSVPFLMVVSTPSPHEPFTPAKRHAGKFSYLKAPRTLNFNRFPNKTKHWLLRLPPHHLPQETIDEIDSIFRNRWETLLAVDELVEAVVKRLSRHGLLENTYLLFSSDHGFHMGQFGQAWDKRQPYETDIRIPMMIRGPTVPVKRIIENPVLTIDIAPFILDAAGVRPVKRTDGKSFLPLFRSKRNRPIFRSFLVEYRGESESRGNECYDDPNVKLCKMNAACKCFDASNNTFVCVRRLTNRADDIFCQFQDGESFREYYDIRHDPFQLVNLSGSSKGKVRQKVLECCERNIRSMRSVDECLRRKTLFAVPEIIQLS